MAIFAPRRLDSCERTQGSIEEEAGGPQSRSERLGKRNPLPISGFKPQTVQLVFTIATKLSRFSGGGGGGGGGGGSSSKYSSSQVCCYRTLPEIRIYNLQEKMWNHKIPAVRFQCWGFFFFFFFVICI